MMKAPVVDVRLSELIASSFYEVHRELKEELYDEYWFKGGRGSTKSTFISVEIILGILQDQDANAVVFRRYQNELRDSVIGQFEWTIAKMNLGHLFHVQVSPMQIIYLPTGQRIIFRGADNPKKLKSINLGRGYIKYAWFEELDQFGLMNEIRNILQSVFRGGDQRRVVFFSYNPPKSARSWVNQEAKILKPGKRVHHSTYLDVPKHWLGERFLADAQYLKRTNELAYRHEYLGEEIGTGLEVFTNVIFETVTDEQIARFDRIRQGLDFGYAAHPACFERMHYDGTRRRLYIFAEVAGLNLSNRMLSMKIQKYNDVIIVADSAEPKSIDELRSYGIRVASAKKGPGSVEFGIKWLQDLEAIITDPQRCPLAAKEFINYSLETDKSGMVKNKFPDKDNHSIDAVRYALEDDMVGYNMHGVGLLRGAKLYG